MLETEILILSF